MPVLTPAAPECASQVGSLCQRLWDWLGVGWLAANADAFVASGLRIVLIVVVALLARTLAHRAIRRLTKVSQDGRLPPLLRTLRARTEAQLLGPRMSVRRRQRADTIGSVLRSLVSMVVFTVAVILILAELGINIGPILASAGIVGVAVGFGAQNLVKDFISGLFMMLEDQYGVGDTVDLGPASGTVMAVSFRITTVRAQDTGDLWYVRNGEITRVGNTSQGAELPPVHSEGPDADAVADTAGDTGADQAPLAADRSGDIHIGGNVYIAGGIRPMPSPPDTPAPVGGDRPPVTDEQAGDTAGGTGDSTGDSTGGGTGDRRSGGDAPPSTGTMAS